MQDSRLRPIQNLACLTHCPWVTALFPAWVLVTAGQVGQNLTRQDRGRNFNPDPELALSLGPTWLSVQVSPAPGRDAFSQNLLDPKVALSSVRASDIWNVQAVVEVPSSVPAAVLCGASWMRESSGSYPSLDDLTFPPASHSDLEAHQAGRLWQRRQRYLYLPL